MSDTDARDARAKAYIDKIARRRKRVEDCNARRMDVVLTTLYRVSVALAYILMLAILAGMVAYMVT